MQALIAYFSAHPHVALVAVFAAAALEALAVIGTVIPGSTVVFVGGVLVGLNALNLWWTAIAAVSGAILGDGISYWLGHHYREHLRTMWPMKNYPSLFDRGQAYFSANGGKSVFFGRFLGPVRAIIPVVAGMADMPARQFYGTNIASAFAWVTAHVLPGALFGASLQVAGAVSARLVVILLAGAVFLWILAQMMRLLFNHGRPHLKSLRDYMAVRTQQKSVLPLVLAALLAVSVLYVGERLARDVEQYADRPAAGKIVLNDWTGAGWKRLAPGRLELGGEFEDAFSIQWAGQAEGITEVLNASGWQSPAPWTSKTMLLWLLPGTSIEQLPVLPKFDHGEGQKLTFVKVLDRKERAVIRLWPSPYSVQSTEGTPARTLWEGMLTIERLRQVSGIVAFATTEADLARPLGLLQKDLQLRHASVEKRQRSDTAVLLIW